MKKVLIIMLLLIVGCSEKNTVERYSYYENGVKIDVSLKVDKGNGLCLKKVFITNASKGCKTKDLSFKATFSKPVFIKDIHLNTFFEKKDIIDGYVGIGLSKDKGMPGEVFYYKIGENTKKIIRGDDFEFGNIFRVKSIEIDLYDKDKSYTLNQNIILQKFKINFNDQMAYKPSMLYNEVEKYFINKNFKEIYAKLDQKNKLKILKDLMYYSLIKESNAENILNNIKEIDVDESEYLTYLVDWYEITKNWNNKSEQPSH